MSAPPVRASGRWRLLRTPAVVGTVGVGAALVLHVRDPHDAYSYGLCPFHAVTGLWCPGCGGLRAVNDLTNGDVVAALSSNIFVPPLVVVLVVAWSRWLVLRWRGSDARMLVVGRVTGYTVLALLVVFTVVRNTPWGAWLAPG